MTQSIPPINPAEALRENLLADAADALKMQTMRLLAVVIAGRDRRRKAGLLPSRVRVGAAEALLRAASNLNEAAVALGATLPKLEPEVAAKKNPGPGVAPDAGPATTKE